MIEYSKLWKTMKTKGITQYSLIKRSSFSSAQITRLKRNEYVSTHTIDRLCKILDCKVEDIMEDIMEYKRDFWYQQSLLIYSTN